MISDIRRVDILMAIDIGGTSTRLAIFDFCNPKVSQTNIKIYKNTLYSGIEDIINDYEKSLESKSEYLVIGASGPVFEGSVKTTNSGWILDEGKLKADFNYSCVKIINDVQAIGYAIELLEESDFEIINKGNHKRGAPIAIIAPGTGLGESYIVDNGKDYRVYSTEGGHSDFAPTNKMEIALLDYLLSFYNHVSYERVCSGQGLYNIYNFLKDRGICIEPDWLKDKLINADDCPKVISENALLGEKAESIAMKAVDIFVGIMGSEVGNMALRFNAENGVYIGGGIAPQILSFLKNSAFIKSFTDKGRLSGYVSNIPVKVILRPDANLYGLANYAMKHNMHRL